MKGCDFIGVRETCKVCGKKREPPFCKCKLIEKEDLDG